MNEGNNFRFDLWLYNQMQRRGWSRQDMAEKTGLDRVTIGYYLTNVRLPTMTSLALILKALGMHMEFVYDEGGTE